MAQTSVPSGRLKLEQPEYAKFFFPIFENSIFNSRLKYRQLKLIIK
jgi:hypothetical protein